MIDNPTLNLMRNRKSIRKYTDQIPDESVLKALVDAAVCAPFAAQTYSILLRREASKNPFGAPLFFVFCVDAFKLEKIMEKRGWKMGQNDLSFLILGIQDAAYAAENMVIAAESLGMGSCYHGWVPFVADKIKESFELPDRVFPLVGLTIGYPAENPPVRPRYPISYTLHENAYKLPTDEDVEDAMRVMDEGYLAQDYYRKANYMVKLDDGMQETFTFDDYSWTEHISRKNGLWQKDITEILQLMKKCRFVLSI